MTGDLLGSVAGPWTVTHIDAEDWHEVTHMDGTKRLMTRYAAEDLLRGARVNGLVSVKARAPEAPRPIKPIPYFGVGDPGAAGVEAHDTDQQAEGSMTDTQPRFAGGRLNIGHEEIVRLQRHGLLAEPYEPYGQLAPLMPGEHRRRLISTGAYPTGRRPSRNRGEPRPAKRDQRYRPISSTRTEFDEAA